MTTLFVNMILQEHIPDKVDICHRILWINEDYKYLVLFNLNDEKAFPTLTEMETIITDLNKEILSVCDGDPYICPYLENELSEVQKQGLEKNWNMIKGLVEKKNFLAISDRMQRGELINELVEKGYTKPTIYYWLRRYFRYGQQKIALAPQLDKRGGKGKDKVLGDKKVGAPRKNKRRDGEGINVSKEMKTKIEKAYAKHYIENKNNTLEEAYQTFLSENFYEVKTISGREIVVPKPNVVSHTFDQFKYWGKKQTNVKEEKKKRIGEKVFNLTQRELLKKSNDYVFGPGSLFQIDSTPADIYLVSSLNPNIIIKRPTLYLIVDVFSRMITGFHVDTRPASLAAAKLTLYSCGMNKVEYCRSLGVDIKPDEWICEHIPFAMVADRGELRSEAVEKLNRFMNITIENTPSYRPDLKGIIERMLGEIQKKAKPYLPGFVDKDFGIRGGKDYRLQAALTIEDFRKYVIEFILMHNQTTLDNYDLTAELIRDNISPIPNELWKWGVMNKSGLLTKVSINELKFNCMTMDEARITDRGVIYANMRYFSEKASEENWFSFSRNKTEKIDIAYDARNMAYIYWRDPDSKEFIVFEMNEDLEDSAKYYGKSLMEIQAIQQYENELKQKNIQQDLEEKLTFKHRVKNIVEKSLERQEKVVELKPSSKSGKIKNINKNNQQENYNRLPNEAIYLEEVQHLYKEPISNDTQNENQDELLEIEEFENQQYRLLYEWIEEE